ncbi:MAG TPA: alpha/beta fold hydrolase, partial [Acidimicrobiia bacterium]|nr:alpha/beta fold hydrolase [Acidimicrobiia bacterium]
YRSAVDVFNEWWPDLDRAPSGGLIIMGGDDQFVPARHGERLAQRVGGECLVLEGCGHWWPLERPGEVAAALERLWASA